MTPNPATDLAAVANLKGWGGEQLRAKVGADATMIA